MRELLAHLLETLDHGRPAAYCRLVETRGSTPQKAGAIMLVYPDGRQAGTLGGGCVEAEVKRLALGALNAGAAQAPVFELDSDYGWDDGLICGGRMQVLIRPIEASAVDYFRTFARRLAEGSGATEVILFDPQQAGVDVPASFLFDRQGQLAASLPAASPPPAWVTEHLEPLDGRPRTSTYHGAAFLPTLPRCRLLIVGGGHVGQAVGALAEQLDFDIWVIDDRSDFASRQRFPNAQRLISGPMEEILQSTAVDSDTYCLIVTRGHQHDERALFHLAQRGARYVGLIGSRRKIRLIFEDLLQQGVPAEALRQVYAPLGIDIGSRTVPEIAVSICAELVAHRNLGTVPGRPPGIDPLAPHAPSSPRGASAP